jgi:subtilisin family serine protease
VAAVVPGLRLQRLKLPPGLSVEAALKHYRSLPEVELAQPNYRYRVARTPDDPIYEDQWHLPQINASSAWNTTRGSRSVVVAVIDTGVDYEHPDLAANMWPDIGYDFVNDDDDPMDDYAPYYHGTHVAGIIGAVGDNGLGLTGVCWRVQIMAVKALDENGDGDSATVAAAIDWAADRGADIINLSLESDAETEDLVLREAIEESGVLVVCAAGNSGVDIDESPVYPGSSDCDNIINVANSNSGDTLAFWSNYGEDSVDLAAPGQSLWSLDLSPVDYSTLSGTSMAAAVVSGAAALLLAAEPGLSHAQLKRYLIESCDDLGLPVASGGRLNLAAAISAASRATSSNDDDGGGCFIATAAYGSPLAREVRWLRAFRDHFLTNPLGLPALRAYYRLGPPPARYIIERGWLRPLVRSAIYPAIPVVRAALGAPWLLATLPAGLFIALRRRRS